MSKKPPMSVRLGLIDKLIAPFSPQSAARRYAARIALGNMARAYDGAQKGRGTDGWRATGGSADAEIAPAAAVLRDRMRDLVRNNPTAAKAISVLVNGLIGTGIRPRANSKNKALNKKVNALFEEWAKKSDADGHTDFYGQQTLAIRSMLEGGDVFALRRTRRASDGLAVPLQIQLLEADHLDAAKNEDRDGKLIRQGIEYNGIGGRSAYWLFPDHPGDNLPMSARRFESGRVEANRVLHVFERQRVQSRGVPWGTPTLRGLRDVDDWQAAELVRKKTEACLVGIVFGADEDQGSIAPQVTDSEGNVIEQFEPGMIAYAHGGKDIKFNTPGTTNGVYEWHSVMLHIIAAGFRVPYELLTGDLRQVNFSSSRVGMQEFHRLLDATQWNLIIPMFCQPIWDWFCEAAFVAGKIPTPTIPVEWAPPKFASVNPLQDATTDLLEVRAGFASVPQMIAKRGYDPNEVTQEIKDWTELVDTLELVLDSDPRRVSKGGQSQANDPLAFDDDTGEPVSKEPAEAKPAAKSEGKFE